MDTSVDPVAVQRSEPALPFPIVGIGASAGGVEAFGQLVSALSPKTGMAFILIPHLAPSHDSMLAEILGRHAHLPVEQAVPDSTVAPNRVYVIPPGVYMVIAGGKLSMAPKKARQIHPRTIDHFLGSLAEDQGHQAVGVILSGTGTDGTLGLEDIKAEGGITFAQDSTAQHEDMPRSAIGAGCVDFVLTPEEIAAELARIAQHPFVSPKQAGTSELARLPEVEDIIELLDRGTQVDFTNYKRATLVRRISRRAVLHKLPTLKAYAEFLRKNPGEIQELFQDILINVTSFFRNPESFEILKTRVFPQIGQSRNRQEPIRVWIQGCSTGEEAYSIAMSYTEFSEASGTARPLQIFATDLNGAGIEKARAGVYSKNIAQDVSPDRLRRFFQENDGSYRITKPIRDQVIFAQHNVLAAPPFSHIDLISCRNLMIYLDSVAQARLVPVLHYALKPEGILWLGHAETLSGHRDMFEPFDARHRFFVRKAGRGRANIPLSPVPLRLQPPVGASPARNGPPGPQEMMREADRVLLTRFAPPAVLVDANLEIIQFRGDTAPYLAPAPGKASLHLLRMLREGLVVGVRTAIQQVRRYERPVQQNGLQLDTEDGTRDVNVEVLPVTRGGMERCYMVLFKDPAAPGGRERRAGRPTAAARVKRLRSDHHTSRLAQELAATREYLQSVIEQHEAANEELQSANEEVQSANEELQSINEELETSKEEIQSSNEELATVNDELQNRNLELSQTNNDFINLLSSVQMAIVMLGPDLRIRRFTPAAEKMMNLIASDVGRPIGDIKLNITANDLETAIREVIDTVSVREQEVQDRQGRWYLLRIRPYRTIENRIDGAVLVLVDVDALKRAQADVVRSEESRTGSLTDLARELRGHLSAVRVTAQSITTGVTADRVREGLTMHISSLARIIDQISAKIDKPKD